MHQAVTQAGGRRPTAIGQAGMRSPNERLVLSLLRRNGALSKAEIARLTALSAQTISVINRQLESDGLVMREARVRGRVGQPSTPMTLDPDGAFSIGLRIGRRSADMALMDFAGVLRHQIRTAFAYPTPASIMEFVRDNWAGLCQRLPAARRDRIAGIGIGAPFELWNWLDRLDAPPDAMTQWRDFDLTDAVARETGLDVIMENDASAACLAEQTVGLGREISDFAYFFTGSFIGGGIVLNHALQTGVAGNAGAFGSLPARANDPRDGRQLIDTASLYTLERRLIAHNIDPADLWRQREDWSVFEPHVTDWLAATADAMADAIVAVCSVFDFPVIVVDGAYPPGVRGQLTARINMAIDRCNTQGIARPDIIAGSVGSNARVIGAAMLPISARFLVRGVNAMA
jgi:predicted NBD/HSP70 family sugar kinase